MLKALIESLTLEPDRFGLRRFQENDIEQVRQNDERYIEFNGMSLDYLEDL